MPIRQRTADHDVVLPGVAAEQHATDASDTANTLVPVDSAQRPQTRHGVGADLEADVPPREPATAARGRSVTSSRTGGAPASAVRQYSRSRSIAVVADASHTV